MFKAVGLVVDICGTFLPMGNRFNHLVDDLDDPVLLNRGRCNLTFPELSGSWPGRAAGLSFYEAASLRPATFFFRRNVPLKDGSISRSSLERVAFAGFRGSFVLSVELPSWPEGLSCAFAAGLGGSVLSLPLHASSAGAATSLSLDAIPCNDATCASSDKYGLPLGRRVALFCELVLDLKSFPLLVCLRYDVLYTQILKQTGNLMSGSSSSRSIQ